MSGQKKTVMICDDEEDLLHLYQRALGGQYNVLTVDSGKECIEKYIKEKAKGVKIDVLILDYRLRDILGDIVACKIAELNGVKTLLISGYELDEKMVNELRTRKCIVEVLRKPIGLKVLVAKIAEYAG